MKIFSQVVCLALFIASSSTYATIGSSMSGGTLGVHAGPAIVGNGSGLHFDLGLNASYPLSSIPFFLGASFSWIDRGTIGSNPNSAKGSTYLVDGSLNYDTSSWFPNSFLGLALGISWDHASTTTNGVSNSVTNSGFIIGPRAGADFPFSSSFSVGGEADWMVSTSNNPNVLELLAVLKWWF